MRGTVDGAGIFILCFRPVGILVEFLEIVLVEEEVDAAEENEWRALDREACWKVELG